MKTARQKMCEKSLRYLQKYQSYFGFADWAVTVEDRTDEPNVAIARAAININEKKLKIILYEDFIDEDTDREDVLIHEFIHARHEIKRQKFSKQTFEMEYELEEEMVNDITRGIMKTIRDYEALKKVKTIPESSDVVDSKIKRKKLKK